MSTGYICGGILLAVVIIVIGGVRVLRERTRRKQITLRFDTERSSAATQIQALNDHLKNKALALETANSELESFSYSVAHDLRTPLRAIGSYAEMLREDFGPQLPNEARRYIDVIRQGTSRMENLITDLLAFSGLGRAQLKVELHNPRISVLRACKEVLANYPNAAPEIEVVQLPQALADSALLYQVWVNVLDNAVKYSSKAPMPRVEVGGSNEGAQTVFYVKDNGVGFDMRYAEKLFGVFERLHGQDEFPGTGVGLAIVQRVVSRHGGRVWADSEPGQGATFYFSLPRSESNERP